MSTLRRLLRSALPSLAILIPVSTSRGADIAAAAPSATPTHGFRSLVTADRTSDPVLAPASREGEIRLKQFRHAPGLTVNLWAAEPMLANPVAFSVDEKGRLFTSETYRYRTSVLDIRHYMFMLEDDLASRTIEDRLANIRKWFGPEGERALSTETEVIRMLEDTDGDGVADKSSVYADGFTSPLSGIASGVLARHGEVWVTEIPSLWKFRAANAAERDSTPQKSTTRLPLSHVPPGREAALASMPHTPDRSVVAEEMLRGFGVRFSFTGHDLHGLTFGPDGRLYFSCGDRGAHVVTREGTIIDLPDEGAVFRCEPDGSRLEVVHRGLRNPQELAFNEYGDLFTGDNDSDLGDRERWVQVIEGADSGWRVGHQHAPLGNAGMWNLERLWVPQFKGQAAYIVPPIANIGDGPSGLVFDATGAYGKDAGLPAVNPATSGTATRHPCRDTFLLSYFKGTSAKSGIYALTVRPKGAGYELVGHDEFLWNSLVPDVDLAPDGAVFFADWHEGWPKSNKGRIYRAYRPDLLANPAMKETAKLLGEGMTNRTERALLDLLSFPDMRVRLEAQFELAGRGPRSFGGMKNVAFESRSRFARLHAIWGIGQIARGLPHTEFASECQQLLELLRSDDTEVRRQTARILGQAGLWNAEREFDRLLKDPAATVVLAALQAKRDLLRNVRLGRPTRVAQPETLSEKVLAILRGQGADHVPQGRHAMDVLGERDDILELMSSPLVISSMADYYAEMYGLKAPANIATPGFNDAMLASMVTNHFWWAQRRPGFKTAQLLALRRTSHSYVSNYLSDPDPLLVLEAARAINDVPITHALPALAELAEPARLNALLKQFAALDPEYSNPNIDPAGVAGIRDVRADQPLPWTNAPMDHLTPMLLRVVNANFRVGSPESATRLAALAARTDLPVLIRTEALNGLATWPRPFPRDRIVGTFSPLPDRDPAPAREALGKSLGILAAFQPPPPLTPEQQARVDQATAQDPGFQFIDTRHATEVPEAVLSATAIATLRLAPQGGTDLLFRMVASQAPTAARAMALRCLAELTTGDSTTGVRVRFEKGGVTVDNPSGDPTLARRYRMLGIALQLSASSPDEGLRLEASKINARLNPDDAAGQLAGTLTGGSIAEQQSAYASLGDLKSDAADALLVEALDRLMQRDVANEVMLDLVLAASRRDATAVKTRLAAYQDWKLPKDHLSPYREALYGGDAARGRKIFYENAAVACTRCHQIGGDGGGNAGPKLDGLATRATREHLLESVVFPNQQVVQGFETAMITLKDGQTYAGVVKSENEAEVTVLSPEEGDVTLKKASIQTREKGLSGMPDGMGSLLTPMELRDVIEFLGTLR